jgi:hypothetical protein
MIEAFDSANNSLGSYSVSSAIDQPLFLGLESATLEIDRVRITVPLLIDADPQDGIDPFPGFAVNRLDILGDSTPRVPDTGNTLGLGLLAWAALGLIAARRLSNAGV